MSKIKALVLCADYPNEAGGRAMAFVHVRNVWLKKHGVDITVLNFATSDAYVIDGIDVVGPNEFASGQGDDANIWILHAPNIRNHYRFLKKSNRDVPKLFFFHGHEALKIRDSYPPDYAFVRKSSSVPGLIQNIYDKIKLHLWRKYFSAPDNSDQLVFVSQWMKNEFFKNTGLLVNDFDGRISVIPNVVAAPFLEQQYDCNKEKEYDFICIRGYLDASKYCIDIVCDLADHLPEYKFLVVGSGHYFEHRARPNNVEWQNKLLNHTEMAQYLDRAKCALMPTRLDAQGVAMCEMATYGIPVLTTDLPICREMLAGFSAVEFFSLESPDYFAIKKWMDDLHPTMGEKCLKFSPDKTVAAERELISKLVEEGVVGEGR